jgi:hypothetical protein
MKMKLYKIPLSFVELRSHGEHNFLFVKLFDNKKVSIVEDTIHLSSNIPTAPAYVVYISFSETYGVYILQCNICSIYPSVKHM